MHEKNKNILSCLIADEDKPLYTRIIPSLGLFSTKFQKCIPPHPIYQTPYYKTGEINHYKYKVFNKASISWSPDLVLALSNEQA